MPRVFQRRELLCILMTCNIFALGNCLVASSAYLTPRNGCLVVVRQGQKEDQDPDLFDYFDPLLSPHQYPDGINPDKKLADRIDHLESEKDAVGLFQGENKSQKGPETDIENTGPETDIDLFEYFDPLLSPHEYPNGISPDNGSSTFRGLNEDENTGSEGKKVGVLLMDHGSRNEASNSRLKHLAKLYQLSTDVENMVVEYSHMEIASPSIPEGLEKLLSHGVDEIICHPYFLSPGRHVREDIPQIVDEAVKSLGIEIPVITTEPVGSNTQLMIGAIHSLVRENSGILQQRKLLD